MIIFDKRNSANSLNIAKYSVTIVNDKISYVYRDFFFFYLSRIFVTVVWCIIL